MHPWIALKRFRSASSVPRLQGALAAWCCGHNEDEAVPLGLA